MPSVPMQNTEPGMHKISSGHQPKDMSPVQHVTVGAFLQCRGSRLHGGQFVRQCEGNSCRLWQCNAAAGPCAVKGEGLSD